MKLALVSLLAVTLSAQIVPPKLSDPFRKEDIIGNLSIRFAPSLFDQMIAQWNSDAARCEASKPDPNPKPSHGGIVDWTILSPQMHDMFVANTREGWQVSVTPCGEVDLHGLTAEDALKRVMWMFADELDRRNKEDARQYKVLQEYFDAGRRRDMEYDRKMAAPPPKTTPKIPAKVKAALPCPSVCYVSRFSKGCPMACRGDGDE